MKARSDIVGRIIVSDALADVAAWREWSSVPDAVRVVCGEDGWLTIVGSYGWPHGDRSSAVVDALWLSANTGLPIRYDEREAPP
jgi:hypothetical protein